MKAVREWICCRVMEKDGSLPISLFRPPLYLNEIKASVFGVVKWKHEWNTSKYKTTTTTNVRCNRVPWRRSTGQPVVDTAEWDSAPEIKKKKMWNESARFGKWGSALLAKGRRRPNNSTSFTFMGILLSLPTTGCQKNIILFFFFVSFFSLSLSPIDFYTKRQEEKGEFSRLGWHVLLADSLPQLSAYFKFQWLFFFSLSLLIPISFYFWGNFLLLLLLTNKNREEKKPAIVI